MNKNPIILCGSDQRIVNRNIDKELRQRDADKLRAAEERERKLLNRFGLADLIIDILYHKRSR